MNYPQELAHALRFLSVDAVEKAQSGHPGMPLGMADIASVLWTGFLKHSPSNPQWFNRDRFVVSNGHGSMLLYALLHLSGYKLTLDDLKNFRQLHSKTPGHPEFGETPGVETTTGPLGQGLANAVGMAIAEKILATRFNKNGLNLVNHHTYCFVGDGCLMEGISHEVASFAGTLKLGKLIVFYDDNGISIDGDVKNWHTDNTAMRFKAYDWQVIGPIDGHNPQDIHQAILEAHNSSEKPTLIICKTNIGYGSPLQGSEKSHGSPLGQENLASLRKTLNWSYAPFEIPESIYKKWNHISQGLCEEQAWLSLCHDYKTEYPEDYAEFLRQIQGDLPDDWSTWVQTIFNQAGHETKAMATRKCSQWCIEQLGPKLPELLGGSADLTGSNNTDWSKTKALTPQAFTGNYINYGVREFGMSAIMNGIALHGGMIPYGGTFLVFSDYAKNAIRLSALMKQRVIYVLSHDSIGLGEDGPTHQPIEHAAMLRMTPNLHVWRPADLKETWVAWSLALESTDAPTCLLLSRQNLKPLPHQDETYSLIAKGGYILKDCEGIPDAIIIASGSEVEIALEAAGQTHQKIRVVSMPAPTVFLQQDVSYQELVLPNAIRKRIAIEAGTSGYWYRFVGLDGKVLGIDSFGVSAKAQEAYAEFGLTSAHVIQTLNEMI